MKLLRRKPPQLHEHHPPLCVLLRLFVARFLTHHALVPAVATSKADHASRIKNYDNSQFSASWLRLIRCYLARNARRSQKAKTVPPT